MKTKMIELIEKYDLPIAAFAGIATGVLLLIFCLVALEEGQQFLNALDGGVAVGF